MTINTKSAPYYDDFNEDKKFYRILFNPKVAVQTRELTQIQSQIQDQINKFGNHIFQNGTVVFGGERFFESLLTSIKINTKFGAFDVNLDSYLGRTITGVTSGTVAIVKQISQFADESQPKTLIVKIVSGDKFLLGEDITYVDEASIVTCTVQSVNAFNDAMIFSINKGVFYIDGNFVVNDAQSIVVDAYSNISSKTIGFDIVESIVTPDEDESLLDPVNNSNFAAPGADRYRVDLQVKSYDIGQSPDNFLELARVIGGELTFVKDRTLYAELEKEFARRTYDESGNYTVTPFGLSFENHISKTKLKANIGVGGSISSISVLEMGETYTSVPVIIIVGDGTGATATPIIDNNIANETYQKVIGVNITNSGSGYTSGETYVQISGDSNKLSLKLEAGKAYIKGFEFVTTEPSYITVNKSRTTEAVDNVDTPLFYGNFLYVNTLAGVFNTDAYATVELHNVVKASVVNASQIGTAKVRFLDYVSGTVGSPSTVYKFYLFDIQMSGVNLFSNLESIVIRSSGSTTPGANVTSGTNIDLLSKFDGISGGDVFLSGADRTSLIFPLNHIYVKELKDSLGNSQNDYTFKRVFPSITFTGGVGSISTNNGLERFVGGAGSYSGANISANYHFVVTVAGTSPYAVGQIISPNSIVGNTISPGASQSLTVSFTGGNGFSASIIASINANAQSEKIKSLQPYTFKTISSPSTVFGGVNSLQTSDIYKMLKVWNTGNVNPSSITINGTTGEINWGAVVHTDVTANYLLDNGQRDDLYDHGSVVLNGTAPASGDYIVVVFNYFTHTNSGFAGVGSYSIPYEEIPFFTSPTDGTTISLADCVDFRPRRVDGGTTLNNGQLPDPDTQFNTDYNYYVGRIDKIVANSSKSFSIKEGIPATIPLVPSDEQDGMTLYVLEVPPYTEKLEDISVKYVDNKRYTMRDIGKLEKRVENLEYYTQLSLLEKQAKDETITDASNFEKFKNGFFVDSFNTNDSLNNVNDSGAWSRQIFGWWNNRVGSANTWNKGASRVYSSSVADSLNLDYAVAIDPLNSEMRAEVLTSFGEYSYVSGTNTRKASDVVTLSYNERSIISNPVASKSININPYDVIAFNGSIKLNPATDTWVETNSLPAVTRVVDVTLPDLPTKTTATSTKTVSSGLLFKETSRTTRVVTNVVGQQTSSLGSDIVDIQYIPFIRARKVIAIGEKFKPKARLYSFFENLPFGQFTKPLTLVQTQNNIGGVFLMDEVVQFRTGSSSGPVVATANVAIYSPPSVDNATIRLLTVYNIVGTLPASGFVTSGLKSATVNSVTNYALGDSLVPDEYGLLGFEFNIPQNVVRTGLRTFKLVDNIDNSDAGSESTGQAAYFAQGILQTTQENILTTRSIQSQTIVDRVGYRYDPLAQTIAVDPRFYPNGYHVTSVDVYFKTKSRTIPVSLEITRTVNGYPESVITSIPFAIVNKMPNEVNVSENGSVLTKFTMPNPIHLVPGEYAIVLKANTQEYEVFVGELGKTDILTNQIISKQPDTGVLFKSQNASTWTAFQEEDLKYNLNIASFETSGVAEFEVNDIEEFRYSYLHLNSSTAIPTNTNILWRYKGLNPGTPNDIEDTNYISIPSNVDIELGQVKKVEGAGSLKVQAVITTTDSNVSPVIDIEGLSTILINNKINMTNISTTDLEEVATGGDALARYITKKITLADGFDASNLVVTMDIFKPNGTDVRVYYKISPTESQTPLDSIEWVRMEMKSPVGLSVNEFDYREHKFYPSNAFGSFGIPVDNPISPRFNIVSVKIVLISQSEAYTPIVRDLRCIALDS